MLVVVEIPDYTDPESLVAELVMLQQSQDSITSDPEFDPDEADGALVLHTEHIEISVTRVVGVLDDSLAKQTSGLYRIERLEATE